MNKRAHIMGYCQMMCIFSCTFLRGCLGDALIGVYPIWELIIFFTSIRYFPFVFILYINPNSNEVGCIFSRVMCSGPGSMLIIYEP